MKLLWIAATTLSLVLGIGQAVAQDFDKGVAAFDSEDYETALNQMMPLAQEGDALAQGYIGLMYEAGSGVVQSYAEALKWYQLSAEQGIAQSQHNVGAMYYNGTGVALDRDKAVKWFRLAAEQGFSDSQYNLGYMYWLGEAGVQDFSEAVKWFRLAAEQGNVRGRLRCSSRQSQSAHVGKYSFG